MYRVADRATHQWLNLIFMYSDNNSIHHVYMYIPVQILSNEEEEEVYRFFDQIGWPLPSLRLP